MRRSALPLNVSAKAALLGLVAVAMLVAYNPGVAKAAEATTARTAFIGAGDKICQASNDRLIAQVKSYETHEVAKAKGARSKKTKVAKPEQVAAFLQKIGFQEIAEELRQLRFLKPPASDAKAVDAMLTGAEEALAKAKKDPTKVAHDDPFSKVSKDFVSFGFTVCGKKIDRPDVQQ